MVIYDILQVKGHASSIDIFVCEHDLTVYTKYMVVFVDLPDGGEDEADEVRDGFPSRP